MLEGRQDDNGTRDGKNNSGGSVAIVSPTRSVFIDNIQLDNNSDNLLIDCALAYGGRYYLPYRLHASPEQFRQH